MNVDAIRADRKSLERADLDIAWHGSMSYVSLLADHLLWRDKAISTSPRFSRRQERAEAVAALRDHAAPVPPTPLPELEGEGLDREAFLRATEGGRRPVVLRGFVADTLAVKTWTEDVLRERLRGQMCSITYTDAERRKTWVDDGFATTKIPFEEFLDRVPHEDMFIGNSDELVRLCPGLVDDLELSRIYETFSAPNSRFDELFTAGFFIASRRIGAEVHCAPGGNFFYNVVGRKRWTLYSPKLTVELQPLMPTRPFTFALSALVGEHSREILGQDTDVLTRLPRYEVMLEPGDLLYNAPWWWHEVRNFSPLTVACAVRHMFPPLGPSPSFANHPLFTAVSVYPALYTGVVLKQVHQRLTGDDAKKDLALAMAG